MPLGPYDQRRKRSRCVQCSSRHLKCLGSRPCNSCRKKGLICEYPEAPPSQPAIFVDAGEDCVKTGQRQGADLALMTRPTIRCPQIDLQTSCIYHFDAFLRRNQFSGSGYIAADVRDLVRQSGSGGYLMDAILSLGAKQSIGLQPTDPESQRYYKQFALSCYSKALVGLRNALSSDVAKHQRYMILWTTLLLGLFELMNDSTGEGWVQHIVHGTATALIASGPLSCDSGFGERFFLEVKIFEVCRAIVFNQPTFLVQPEWQALSEKLRAKNSDYSWRPMDLLLDIIAMCSTLRVRASLFIESLESPSRDDPLLEGLSISLEGRRLRDELESWAMGYGSLFQNRNENVPSFNILAETFHAATSIYLSGVFDYEMVCWQSLGIEVPTLDENSIQIHVNLILELSGVLLSSSRISPVLLMFPLRVAGARSWTVAQQTKVMQCLDVIEGSFAVALAFRSDLKDLWDSRESLDTSISIPSPS